MKFAKFAWQENNERRQKKDRKKVGEMANFQQKEVTKKRERECVCVCVRVGDGVFIRVSRGFFISILGIKPLAKPTVELQP